MRKSFLLVLVLQCGLLSAQNWALLNPEYRYNYSNDGTDTISNQIRVMHVDTLGPDSFRYELNKIAIPCPDCSGGCNLQVNLPQFMQMDCYIGNGGWSFSDSMVFKLKPYALLNEQWLFDSTNSTIGTVTDIFEGLVFGAMDSVRTMTTTLNDTICWSRSHGIILWHMHDGVRYSLIGIQGLQVGILIPSFSEFFPFQTGDIVQFSAGGMSYLHTSYTFTKFHVQERIETPGHIIFTGYANRLIIGYYGEHIYQYEPNYSWTLDSATNFTLQPLSSWPGEEVILQESDPTYTGEDAIVVAKHYRDSTGTYFITGEAPYGSAIRFVLDTASVNCLSVGGPPDNDLRLDTQLGLRHYSWDVYYAWSSISTIGAVISGDTIGTVYTDEYLHVGIEEPSRTNGKIFPVPADDHIKLSYSHPGSDFSITDMEGRQLLSGKLNASLYIDVHRLPPGIYLLIQNEFPPQRFVIAR